jgi:hypothetical protein
MAVGGDAQLDERRRLAAERMARSRERRRQGFRTIPVDIHATEIAALVRRGLLAAGDMDDAAAVGGAVGALLDEVFP